jgi:hypothetical protein
MGTGKKWLPSNHIELYTLLVMLWTYLTATANRSRLGFGADTPQGIWLDTVYAPAYNTYVEVYARWLNWAERTPRISTELEEAEAVLKPLTRTLYTGFLRTSPLVTDDDLQAMGLPKHSDGSRHPAPVETHYPGFRILTDVVRQLRIDFYDIDTQSKAKPAGQHGAEIRWAILDTPPMHMDDLVRSSFDTDTPLTLTFDEDQRGKKVYFALCWENTVGEKGPFSSIQEAVIP